MTWGEVAFVAVATLGITIGFGIACMLILRFRDQQIGIEEWEEIDESDPDEFT